jgi:CubicO group peptidase (beta-lactamase class C family)
MASTKYGHAALAAAMVLIGPALAVGAVFPGAKWQVAEPASQGVDAAKLETAIEYLKAHSGRNGARQLFIVRNGYVIWQGDQTDKVHGIWSCTKSFTSTCLGLLIDDGKCTLDTLAADYLPAMAKTYPKVTLRHFATMTSGYRAIGDEPRGGYLHGPSTTPFVPARQPLFPPGSHYAYWDSAMNQLANALTRIAGEPLDRLFDRRIAEPLGMDSSEWRWGDFGELGGPRVNGGSGNNNDMFVIPAWRMVIVRLGLDQADHPITDEEYGHFLQRVGRSVTSDPSRPGHRPL